MQLSPYTPADCIIGWQTLPFLPMSTVNLRFPVLAQQAFELNVAMVGMQCLIAAWIFVLGACFGSFLNVVIYRLPAGMSLGKPKSRCPRCETPLAARDNIPVLGWIFLRGRCRYCQLPIAARYPIIESICGGIFLILLFGELLSGAANLPLRHPDHFHIHPGFWLVWFAKWDLSGIYLYHCCLLILILAVAMIGYDGHRPQKQLTMFALLIGLGFGTMWPELRPVPGWLPYPERLKTIIYGFKWTDTALNPGAHYWTGVTLVGFFDGILGALGGLLFGRLTVTPFKHSTRDELPPHVAAVQTAFVIAGAFLGWQATGMLAVLMLPFSTLSSIAIAKSDTAFDARMIAPGFFSLLFAFILFWQILDAQVWMIGYDGWKFSPMKWQSDWLITTFGLLFISVGLRRLIRQNRPTPILPEPPPQQVNSDAE